MAEKNLTTGSVPHLIWKLSLPVMGSMALQSTYALVDLYWVGRLGGASLAGLGISLNTFFIVLAMGMAVGVGALATISQTYGRGDRDGVTAYFIQVLWLVAGIGGVAWVVGLLLAEPFIGWFTADEAVHAQGVAYFRIYTAVFFSHLFLIAVGFCWRAVGDFLVPTMVVMLTLAVNMVLDPLLIFGWGPLPALGISGAAYATVASQFLGVALYAYMMVFHGGKHLLVLRRPLRPNFALQWRMLRIGLLSGLQTLFFAIGLMLVYRVVRPYGGDASASVGVGFRIIQAGILPVVAVGAAVASLVGQNHGGNRPDRVRVALLWGLGYALCIDLVEYGLLAAAPTFWVGLFTEEPAIISLGASFLLIYGLSLPLHGPGQIITAMAQGLGRTGYPLLGQAVRVGALFGGVALIGPVLKPGAVTVFWVGTASVAVELVLMLTVGVHLWNQMKHPELPQEMPSR